METTYDAPEDDPFKGAVLEICEIQVKGCVINWKLLRFTSYKLRILNNIGGLISYITQPIISF